MGSPIRARSDWTRESCGTPSILMGLRLGLDRFAPDRPDKRFDGLHVVFKSVGQDPLQRGLLEVLKRLHSLSFRNVRTRQVLYHCPRVQFQHLRHPRSSQLHYFLYTWSPDLVWLLGAFLRNLSSCTRAMVHQLGRL